jgi:hypothetical protein
MSHKLDLIKENIKLETIQDKEDADQEESEESDQKIKPRRVKVQKRDSDELD